MDNIDQRTTDERLAQAPLPTARELRRRRNVVVQFARFVGTSWTMWRLAQKHH
ncbi:hypothetical protein Lsed01_02038 [Demequina sediminis]|jgi:hypothetical protein|uniref:Uncharacterized protein n=1 Tax=Demequina sediminis TaxID=1930058 RepID=A0ABP9WIC0_9MICO|nr:hypothetical protein [Demequina sediminis]BDZ61601.1 hypothetical protein GCM10025873_13920 [Demequina sediminis]